ncbi:hypothetical protein ACIOD1_08970 [Streptomyces sp. NPDC088097]
MKRWHVWVTALTLVLASAGAGSAQATSVDPAAAGADCPAAELFATDNTAVITDRRLTPRDAGSGTRTRDTPAGR